MRKSRTFNRKHRLTGDLPYLEGLAHRWAQARRYLESQTDTDIGLDELAKRVSKQLGRDVSKAMLSQYQCGDSPPKLDTLEAYAHVCGVDPGWLAFGAGTRAPAPGTNELQARRTALDDPGFAALKNLSAEEVTPATPGKRTGALRMPAMKHRRKGNG